MKAITEPLAKRKKIVTQKTSRPNFQHQPLCQITGKFFEINSMPISSRSIFQFCTIFEDQRHVDSPLVNSFLQEQLPTVLQAPLCCDGGFLTRGSPGRKGECWLHGGRRTRVTGVRHNAPPLFPIPHPHPSMRCVGEKSSGSSGCTMVHMYIGQRIYWGDQDHYSAPPILWTLPLRRQLCATQCTDHLSLSHGILAACIRGYLGKNCSP